MLLARNPIAHEPPRLVNMIERARQRVQAEAWVLDAARRHSRSRQLRQLVERRRADRLVRSEGSVDAALDFVVRTAIEKGTG